MNEFWRQIFSRGTLFATGLCLVLFGAMLWRFPQIARQILESRDAYAANLRASGKDERARRIEAESAILRRRIPLYGRTMMVLGAVILVAAFCVAEN